MLKRRLILLMLAVLSVVSGSAYATTVLRLSLEDMTKKAQSIVMGTVTDSRTYWSGKLILTTYTMEVQETIKGQPARTVELTTVGGTVGDTTLHVAGMPAFEKGEDAFVFVQQSGAFSTVVGLAQGKFAVRRGEVVNMPAALSFPDGQPGQAVKMPIAVFKKQVRAILDRQ